MKEITGAVPKDLMMQIDEDDKRLSDLKRYSMVA